MRKDRERAEECAVVKVSVLPSHSGLVLFCFGTTVETVGWSLALTRQMHCWVRFLFAIVLVI